MVTGRCSAVLLQYSGEGEPVEHLKRLERIAPVWGEVPAIAGFGEMQFRNRYSTDGNHGRMDRECRVSTCPKWPA